MSISRFDRAVFFTIAILLGLFGLLIWRGDQVGLPVADVQPPAGSSNVSTAAALKITFDQDLAAANEPLLDINPSLAGEMTWQGRTLIFKPTDPLLPDTTYQITLAAGITSRQGRRLLAPVNWAFTTGHPQVIYIGWDTAGQNQLYSVDPAGGEPHRLSDPAEDVLDFAVSPDGATIAYAVFRDDGGSDLWRVNRDGQNRSRLLDCPQGACNKPLWTPDGRRLLYERRTFPSPNSPPGPPRLWWCDVATGQTVALFEDSQWLGLEADFAANGRWLSYVSPQSQEVQLYNLETGQTYLIPSQTGEAGRWNADGSHLVFTQIQFPEEGFATHLFLFDLANQAATDISSAILVNDGSPAWSPDGQWIAFGRKVPQTATGKQLWLIRPDGSDSRALTDAPEIHHGPPAWSPDGRYLVFQRYQLIEPGAEPAIWLLEIATGSSWPIAAAGIQPDWLP